MRHGRPHAFILTTIFLVNFWSSKVHSQEIYEFYTGARQLAMGGAYVAVVNDETSVLTNPTGLGKLRDMFLTIFDPEAHLGTEASKMLNTGNYSSITDVQKLLDLLNEHKGKHFHAKAQMFPSIVFPNFGLGVLGKTVVDAEVNEAGTVYRLDYTNDYALSLGANLRLFDGVVKIGFSGRLINRVEVHEDLDATATDLTMEQVASEGMGAAGDVGILLSAPFRYLPSIGAVWRDVGTTSYSLADGMFYSTGERRPQSTSQSIDVGIGIFPILANGIRMTIAADYRDILTYHQETNHIRRVHAGLELNIYDFFFARGGMNQGFWTGGVEFASEFFQMQLTTYGEDIGTSASPREDRRYVGKIAIRF